MSEKQEPKLREERIMIMRLDQLGDLILTLQAVWSIKEYKPEAALDIVVHEDFKEFVQSQFNDATVYGIRRGFFRRSLDALSILWQTRNKKYIYAFDLFTGTNHFSSLLLLLTKAKRKCGYAVGIRKYYLTDKVQPSAIKYEEEMVLDILRVANIQIRRKEQVIEVPKELESTLKQRFFRKNTSYMVIHPWAAEKEKMWQEEKFVDLVERVGKEKSVEKIVLVGAKQEQQRAVRFIEKISTAQKEKIINTTGLLTIVELAAIIKSAAAFIGNNSGPMHIAAAVKTPAVIISGYSSPIRWDPPWKETVVLRAQQKQDIEQQCAQQKKEQRNKELHTAAISVDQVYAACMAILKRRKRKRENESRKK